MNLREIIKRGNFDLHMHTTASDGVLSPAEIVKMAVSKGIESIAITDHDTPQGINEAVETGKNMD